MSGPDFRIVDEDIQRLTRDLKTVAQAFADDTHAAGDVSGAFGHQRLAEVFSSFSESWRVNRERMQKNIEELATAMGNIKIATDQVDDALGGEDAHKPPTQTPNSQPPADTGSNQAPTSSGGSSPSGGGSSSGTLPSTSASAAVPAVDPAGTPAATPVDPATPDAETGDDTTVRVGDDGDFYASVTVGGAGAAGATATLMALYKLWDAHRGQVTGNAAPTPESEQADARSRLLAGLKDLGGDGKDVTVELVSEGQSPDHVTAILKGEDGSVEVIDLSPDATADPAAPAGDSDSGAAGGGSTGDGASGSTGDGAAGSAGDGSTGSAGDGTTPPADPPGNDAGGSSGQDGADAGGASASDSLPKVSAPADTGGGGQPSPTAGGETLAAVSGSSSSGSDGSSAGGWVSGHADAASGAAASATTTDESSGGNFAQSMHSPQVAGATAGMGMAGMGAVSAAGISQGGAGTPARNQNDTLRKVTESAEDERKEEKR